MNKKDTLQNKVVYLTLYQGMGVYPTRASKPYVQAALSFLDGVKVCGLQRFGTAAGKV